MNHTKVLPADLPEWDEAVSEAYQLKKIIIENDKTQIRLFSTSNSAKYYATAPYFYDGGVKSENAIISGDISEKLDSLLQENKVSYLLLKSRENLDIDLNSETITDTDYYTFLLDLSVGADEVWDKYLKSKTRNQVRKAEKYNFEIRIGDSSLLNDFYSVISEAWRDLGTPTHSIDFYQLVLEKLKSKSSLMVIYYQGKPVSCALLLMVDKVIYHPYSCTLNRVKSTCVNNLLYWEIIKFACENNFFQFDMGRSKSGQGTFKYKESWGAEPIQLFYTYILKDKSVLPTYDKVFYKLATGAWRFMPLSLANKFGPYLIKNVL